ncbi:MAG: hypothetical protein AABW73_00515 [Nanoarchaeota archaeon]
MAGSVDTLVDSYVVSLAKHFVCEDGENFDFLRDAYLSNYNLLGMIAHRGLRDVRDRKSFCDLSEMTLGLYDLMITMNVDYSRDSFLFDELEATKALMETEEFINEAPDSYWNDDNNWSIDSRPIVR